MSRILHWNFKIPHLVSTFLLILLLLVFINFELSYHVSTSCDFEPIDVVYTWVNGSDPKFQENLNIFKKTNPKFVDVSHQRYTDKEELRFSLRSLEKYARWINHVYIVTNGQIPYWLNLDYEKVTLISHEDIIEDYYLPTFSSPAIEFRLHRIPGVSKRFIYFNDDVFLRGPIHLQDFHSPNKGFIIYLSWLLLRCTSQCSWLYVADGSCDKVCNISQCQMDGGDCAPTPKNMPEITLNFEDFTGAPLNLMKPLNFSVKQLLQEQSNFSRIVAEYNKRVAYYDKVKRIKNRPKKNKKRVDVYWESLQHTNRVLNDFYGFLVRMVPSHAPILIDREIMNELQQKFKKFVDKTVRNRVRTIDDLQFSFTYYYFLIHEKSFKSIDDIFDEFDTDNSGVWSFNEMRTVTAKLYDLPLTDADFDNFTNILSSCSNFKDFVVSKEFVKSCDSLKKILQKFNPKPKFKHQVIKDSDKKHVAFHMLNSNFTQVLRQLDDVRKTEKKFVCLNDNSVSRLISANDAIATATREFYEALFPIRSNFELPDYYRNRFLYIQDYKEFLNNRQKRLFYVYIVMVVIFFIILLTCFKRTLFKIVNTLLN